MPSGRQKRQLVFFAALAVTSYILWATYHDKPLPQKPDVFTRGYAASGVTGRISNEQGKFTVHFTAAGLVQYEYSDTVEISQPEVWINRESTLPWRFQAREGRFERQERQFFFKQQVRLENFPQQSREKVLLTTDSLVLEPDRQAAFTDAPVSLTGQVVSATAIGAEMDFGNNQYRLLSHVKVEYHETTQSPAP